MSLTLPHTVRNRVRGLLSASVLGVTINYTGNTKNLNDLTKNGIYRTDGCQNSPEGWSYMLTQVMNFGGSDCVQVGYNILNGEQQKRYYSNSNWSNWITIYDTKVVNNPTVMAPLSSAIGIRNFHLTGTAGDTFESGISINRGNGGCTAVVVFSSNTSNGTNTVSIVGQLQFYYDGNNLPTFTKISGNDELANYVQIGKDANNQLIFTKVVGHQMYMSFFLSR